MSRLARWCFQHRTRVLLLWLLALAVVAVASAGAGSAFNSNLSLSGTDSHAAQTLLSTNFPALSGEADQVVFQASHGATIASPAVRDAVNRALARWPQCPASSPSALPTPRAPVRSRRIRLCRALRSGTMNRYQLARWAPVVVAVGLALVALASAIDGHVVSAVIAAILAIAAVAGVPAARKAARYYERGDST